MVMAGDSCSEGRGFEPQHRMNVFPHIFVVMIEKELAGDGPFKNRLFSTFGL